MHIYVRKSAVEKISGHGEAAFPEECCGMLVGRRDEERMVLDAYPAKNVHVGSRNIRYMIDPIDFLNLTEELEGTDLEIIGFYHSHPNVTAKPSKSDLDRAWPLYSYMILSVWNGTAGALTSWVLREDRTAFLQEELIVK